MQTTLYSPSNGLNVSIQGVEFPGKSWFCLTTWLGSAGCGDLAVGTGAHVGPGAETVSTRTPADCWKEENAARSNNTKTCSVRWKIKQADVVDSCQDFFFLLVRKKKIHVMCLLLVKPASCRFWFSAPIWFELGHGLSCTQNFASKYFQTQAHQSPGQAFHSTFIIVKWNRPTWQRLQAILLFHFFFLLQWICTSVCFEFFFFFLFPTGCCWHDPPVPAPIR